MTLKLSDSSRSQHKFARTLVRRHKLVPHLDKFLSTEVTDFKFEYEPKLHDDGWHPSGHCTPLASDLYEIASAPPEPKKHDVGMMKTFLVGHFWHQLLQHAVVRLDLADPSAIERRGVRGWGFEIPHEVEWGTVGFFPWHYSTGSGDIAPCVLPRHGEYVVDFKTMSAHQYKGEGIPNWAAVKYEAQINIYMDYFDLDRGLIVAICKDTPHEMKEFEFERNQPLIDAIYDKWEFVSECVVQGIPPTRLDDDMFGGEDALPTTGPVAQ